MVKRNHFLKPPTDRKGGYIIISGNKLYSPNNDEEIKAATVKNKNGIWSSNYYISCRCRRNRFKCIRQIHLMEPWYDLNRIDQIVGKCRTDLALPLRERNVQIFCMELFLIHE